MQKRIAPETDTLFNLLAEVQATVEELEEFGPFTVIFEDGKDKKPSQERAALSRALLRAAELSNLLGQELHLRYWQVKGFDDPRTRR